MPKMPDYVKFLSVALFPLLCAQPGWSQTSAQSDVLIFTNGDKLTGHLQRTKGGDVTFKSDMAAEFTVDWGKIRELQTAGSFAVIPKSVKVTRGSQLAKIPQGPLTVENQQIQVRKGAAPAPATVPTGNAGYIVDSPTFQNTIVHSPGFLHGWTGAVAAGVSLVEATQNNNTFSGAVDFVRVAPSVSWMDRRDRTTFDLNFAYGKLTQPATPDIKTALYHIAVERDQYFTPRLYAFGSAAFDHNYSQGLDLQQNYSGGLGFTALLTDTRQLDLKAGVSYIRQQFTNSALNQSLIGSTFSEAYRQKLPRNILFTQGLLFTPAWNNTNAYSAVANAGLSAPLYKNFALSLNAIDNFLNNPPPGFRKNSFQFTTALAYTF